MEEKAFVNPRPSNLWVMTLIIPSHFANLLIFQFTFKHISQHPLKVIWGNTYSLDPLNFIKVFSAVSEVLWWSSSFKLMNSDL